MGWLPVVEMGGGQWRYWDWMEISIKNEERFLEIRLCSLFIRILRNAAKSSFEIGRDGGDIMFDSFRSTFSLPWPVLVDLDLFTKAFDGISGPTWPGVRVQEAWRISVEYRCYNGYALVDDGWFSRSLCAKSTLIKFGLIVLDDGEGSAKNNGFLGKNYTPSKILQGFGGLRMEDNLQHQLNATTTNPICSSI